LTELVGENVELLHKKVGKHTVRRFVELIRKKGFQAQFLTFLMEVCGAAGEACDHAQTLISTELLEDRKNYHKLLIQTRLHPRDGRLSSSKRKWTSKSQKKTGKTSLIKEDGGAVECASILQEGMMPVEVYWANPKQGMSSQQLFGSKWIPLEILVSAFVEKRPPVETPPATLGENRGTGHIQTATQAAAGKDNSPLLT
jgi:hypothetical protein